MSQRGVLLVNLGSPDSTSVKDVRRYLREFLMDANVLDIPFLSRLLIVNLLILPLRPGRSAEAYRKIWTPEGSPLVVISHKVTAALRARVGLPIELAMRYQKPSIEKGLRALLAKQVDEILVIPLYPHYALSSYETVVLKVRGVLARIGPQVRLRLVPPFFDEADYVRALVASATPYLRQPHDYLLFSFHGLPERHLRKTDPTRSHCLARPDCCQVSHVAHQTCYRAQAFRTVQAFVAAGGIPAGQYGVAFQSRLGRDPWLKPYTDLELERLPKTGVRNLLVICPAFVSDCLETLEEIGLRGREAFRQAGGSDLTLIPCLNENPFWIEALERMVTKFDQQPATWPVRPSAASSGM